MLRPPNRYSSTAAWNRRPSHSSHVVATVAMTPRSVYTTPAPLQAGQAPSEFALNSAALTPLALANAVRIGSRSPVYVAGLLRLDPRIGVWSIATTPSWPATEPWISELLPDPATPVTTTSTPVGMSTSTFLRLCALAPRISRAPAPVRTVLLHPGAVIEVAAGHGAAGPQALDGALEDQLSPGAAGTRTEVDHVVGDPDDLGLVLDDEHGVALVAQPQQQVVHPPDVVRVEARWWARRTRT
jgi:hypothetical protein